MRSDPERQAADSRSSKRQAQRPGLPRRPCPAHDNRGNFGRGVTRAKRHKYAALARLRVDRRSQGPPGAAIAAERATGAEEPPPEYRYYPDAWPEPYLTRRRALGWRLYGLLGIAKGDRAAARAWQDRNFNFFGAPVGLIFTLDRRLAIASFIDLAMFMQSISIAARAFGLDTCPQAAFAHYHAIIRDELRLPENEMVICGMALGYEDPDAPANSLRADREPIDAFAVFREE